MLQSFEGSWPEASSETEGLFEGAGATTATGGNNALQCCAMLTAYISVRHRHLPQVNQTHEVRLGAYSVFSRDDCDA